jgi:hypothetical protein
MSGQRPLLEKREFLEDRGAVNVIEEKMMAVSCEFFHFLLEVFLTQSNEMAVSFSVGRSSAFGDIDQCEIPKNASFSEYFAYLSSFPLKFYPDCPLLNDEGIVRFVVLLEDVSIMDHTELLHGGDEFHALLKSEFIEENVFFDDAADEDDFAA